MAKKRSLFNLLRRLFFSEAQAKTEKDKRRKWMFGRLKIKRFASLTAPAPTTDKTMREAEEEHSNRAINAANATAAAEVALLTGVPDSGHECRREADFRGTNTPAEDPRSTHQCEKEVKEYAAVKIQIAYRGYLARKALRALKGIVRLQAIIRGQAVRRQAFTSLKSLQSIVSIQSQVCARRHQMVRCSWHADDKRQLLDSRKELVKQEMEFSSPRRWDDRLLSQEEADALHSSRKEAALKRARIKEYCLIHRKSTESEHRRGNGRYRYWLEQWVDTQLAKSREMEDVDSVLSSNRRRLSEEFGGNQPRLRNPWRQNNSGELDSQLSAMRRSCDHKKKFSVGNVSSSLVLPTYMAATESTRAKARPAGSPRPRPVCSDTCSETYSPHKKKLVLTASLGGDVPRNGRISRSSYQDRSRSPCLKHLTGPKMGRDLSFESENAFSY